MVALRMFGARTAAVMPFRHFQASAVRMISGTRFQNSFNQRKNQENTGHGFRGCILKPLDGFNRGFASSQGPSGSGKGKNWLMAMGAAVLGIGGAAYAYLQTEDGRIMGDQAFKWVEDTLGLAPTPVPSKITAKVETKGIGSSSSVKHNKTDEKSLVSSGGRPNEVKCAGEDCVEKKCGDSDCLRKMDKEEELIAKANSELEKALKDVKPKAVEYTESALKAYCETTDLIKLFMDKVYCAIEEDNLESPRFEEVWCDVYDTALKRCEKVKDAVQKGQCAWELLCRLREVIENGKACKYTSCNPLLITAEESLLCAERELLNAKSKMECIQSESRLVEQYRNVVEDFRRDLKAEVDSMITSDECKQTLTGNECTMVITHAYKKVLRIQKELAQVQMATELRESFERDIVEALKRQALAYQENFDNQINVLKSEYERRIQQQDKIFEAERVVELQAKYNQASAALAAIEKGIEARQEMNAKSQKLRKLWSTCNTLFSRVNYAQYYAGQDAALSYATINSADMVKDFKEDAFASQLIKSLPEKVTSFEDLKQRFFDKLEPTCRKTMILKEGEKLSLWKYALGSLESLMIARCEGERKTAKKTYEILDRAGFHLKRGDLLEAAITLNSLTGLPRQIAKDWLDDARAVLETNQTLFTLMTYAASNNVY
ncbi:MICOS complex subunit MIC60 isoform X2 [Folsomia candida]|uniref:MICOS complex subunit MIC60 isoform X2 n=1 Tax=Folsomia candida TaxID=158441 RepID=UPI000B8F57A0|nr:MICOS complex subunit MIC60 isoform X2 [Folsomia candida]